MLDKIAKADEGQDTTMDETMKADDTDRRMVNDTANDNAAEADDITVEDPKLPGKPKKDHKKKTKRKKQPMSTAKLNAKLSEFERVHKEVTGKNSEKSRIHEGNDSSNVKGLHPIEEEPKIYELPEPQKSELKN